jgi:hypothetical protein
MKISIRGLNLFLHDSINSTQSNQPGQKGIKTKKKAPLKPTLSLLGQIAELYI